MTVDLTAEEMELLLHALKLFGERKEQEGASRRRIDDLVARLEVAEREQRGLPPGGADHA